MGRRTFSKALVDVAVRCFSPPKVSLYIKNKVQARHQSLWGLDPAYFGAQLAGSLPCSCPGHLLLPPSTPGPSRLLIRRLRLCPPPFSWDQSSLVLRTWAPWHLLRQSTECHTIRSPAPHQAVLMTSPCYCLCIICHGRKCLVWCLYTYVSSVSPLERNIPESKNFVWFDASSLGEPA